MGVARVAQDGGVVCCGSTTPPPAGVVGGIIVDPNAGVAPGVRPGVNVPGNVVAGWPGM